MFKAVKSPYLVPFKGSVKIAKLATKPPKSAPGSKEAKERLSTVVEELDDLQRVLYADNRHSLLLVFQAMDAAGKDGTIRAVLSGINPAGFQVFSFKQPSSEELDHDYLWRTARALPERGRIGVFNRSYYEEVLVVRVHPEYLKYQRLPGKIDLEGLWSQRYASIRDHEQHLARNGYVILKFFLNVSKEEQRRRFLSRIDEANKQWKFSNADVAERRHWSKYMRAYEDTLRATSRSWAPWYAIPADDKPYMRLAVAEILRDALKSLKLKYPKVTAERKAELSEMREVLEK